MNTIKIGDKVKVIRTSDSFYNKVQWWPEDDVTGIVEALHKNGSVRIACHQFKNTSQDGLLSKTFSKGEINLELLPI